ncbi:MAG: thrombospondin type 3 repeat-containing protein [Reyranella sp.]|nr:thrombospondin type 3 repeat-containing protein [Reyranella sp.]
MRNPKVLVSVAVMLATAGCVETMGSGYPATSYGNRYGSGYSSQPSYYSQPVYQSRPTHYSAPPPVVVTQTRYVPVAVPVPTPRTGRVRDRDHDGIPDRYDRDKNGDGVPDRYQQRRY